MPRHALFLSVRPTYARRILQGKKTVELRRVRPRISEGALLLLYVSSPVKAVQGISVVERITAAQPDALWRQVAHNVGVTRSEFDDYFEGARMAIAIHLGAVQALSPAITLSDLRGLWPGFCPPQSYQYFTRAELFALSEITDAGSGNGNLAAFAACQVAARPVEGLHENPRIVR